MNRIMSVIGRGRRPEPGPMPHQEPGHTEGYRSEASPRRSLPVASTAQVRRYMRDLVRRHPDMLRAAVALNVATALAALPGPRLLGDMLQGVQSGESIAALDRIALTLAGFVLLQAILTRFTLMATARVGERILSWIREDFVDRILALPLRTAERASSGDLLTRATRDAESVAKSVRLAVPESMTAVITLIAVVIALLLVSPVLAVPVLLAAPVLVVASRWYWRRAPRGYQRQNVTYSRVTERLTETVDGAQTVEAFGLQRQRAARTDTDLRRSWSAERYTLSLRSVWWPLVETSHLLSMVATLLIGGWFYLNDIVTLGQLTAAVIYAQQLTDPLDRLVGWLDELHVGSAALSRLIGVNAENSQSPLESPAPSGTAIELRRVQFSYRPDREVLHGIDLIVEPGERLAVVGVSGAGKSTLGRLLAGIEQPTAGTVTVGGVPLSELPPDRMRAEIALVTQEHHVFIGTLRDNVAIADRTVPEAEIRAALAAVHALDWANDLPHGLDTLVGAGGHALSPAQAQQVSLARVVLSDAQTLVLDEATASLDRLSAQEVERSLARALEGRTIVTIAHRLFSTQAADRIAVIEAGHILELGSHKELIAADGTYAALWRVWHGGREEKAITPASTRSSAGAEYRTTPRGDLRSPNADPPPSADDTTREPQRFLVGNFPSHAPLGEEISLILRVTQQPSGAQNARFSALSQLAVGAGGANVRVIVEATRGLALHSPLEQVIYVPERGDSGPVRFAFRATTLDVHRLRVTAWAGGTFLAEIAFEFAATEGRPGTETSTKRASIDSVHPHAGEVTLQVQKNGGRYSFQLLSEMQMFDPVLVETISSGPDETTEQIIQTLRQLARGAGGYTQGNVRNLMQSTGIALWDSLVPETIQDQFWQLRANITTFSIATGLDTVPWELMYPMTKTQDDGFLIEQVPVTRRVYNQARSRSVNIGGARFVVPPGSPRNATEEIRSIHQIVSGDGEPPVVSDLAQLLRLLETGELGLVHFACHNSYHPKAGGSSITMNDGAFVPTLLERTKKMEALAVNHPLIFINACRSAGMVPHYTRMMGWAQQFLAAGAGGFVGTLWDVRSNSAQSFAECFYSSLTDGATLGEAALTARREAARQDDDPTWLAYSFYGDPNASPVWT